MEQQDSTKAIRTRNKKTQYNEHSTPMYLTSSFTFDNVEDMRLAFSGEVDTTVYSRFVNPNYSELINKMCALEGTEAGYATATGMAAIYASIVSIVGNVSMVGTSMSEGDSTIPFSCSLAWLEFS